nr:MAG TPA: hypothetical protein [Caudoviricetes sp.]
MTKPLQKIPLCRKVAPLLNITRIFSHPSVAAFLRLYFRQP